MEKLIRSWIISMEVIYGWLCLAFGLASFVQEAGFVRGIVYLLVAIIILLLAVTGSISRWLLRLFVNDKGWPTLVFLTLGLTVLVLTVQSFFYGQFQALMVTPSDATNLMAFATYSSLAVAAAALVVNIFVYTRKS